MPNEELARKNVIVTVTAITPDACYTPGGSVASYSVVSEGQVAEQTASSVNACGDPAIKTSSIFACCYNDEAAVAGVKSGTVGSICEPLDNSSTVLVEGCQVVRDGDIVWMNNRNCLGIVSIVVPSGAVVINAPENWYREGRKAKALASERGADYVDTSKLPTYPDLSKYDKVIIQGHGAPGAITNLATGEGGMNAEQVSDFLEQSGFQGSSVEVANCNSATQVGGNASFAEELSQELGIPVTGYAHELAINANGTVIRRLSVTGTKMIDMNATQLGDIVGLDSTKAVPETFPK